MPRLRRAHLAAMCSLAIVALSAFSDVHGGKPQPPPPPPPPNPFLIYQWRPDLGGWLDTQTNLVWGYSFWDLKGHGLTQLMAVDAAADYPDIFYEAAYVGLPGRAAETEAHADWQVEQGDLALAAGDPELAADWYAAAAANYAWAQRDRDNIPLFEAAGDAASQYTWRLPTQQEAQTALYNGLFIYGPGGFDSYDASPYDGLDYLHWTGGGWTSTTRRNGREAWTYRPDGNNSWQEVNRNTYNAIYVRTHVP